MILFLTQLFARGVLMRLLLLALLTSVIVSGEAGAGAAADATASPLRIMIYGDSLAAGYGLKPADGFAPQLERALAAQGIEADIHNASKSGETTAGGLARLKWNLDGSRPDMIILELGANDALRALPPAKTRANLDGILRQLKKQRITILLTGMMAPPNLGPVYVKEFNAIYPELARKHKVVLYSFFLNGVAGQRQLNLRDGMHPNAKGIKKIVSEILPYVKKTIKTAQTKRKTK